MYQALSSKLSRPDIGNNIIFQGWQPQFFQSLFAHLICQVAAFCIIHLNYIFFMWGPTCYYIFDLGGIKKQQFLHHLFIHGMPVNSLWISLNSLVDDSFSGNKLSWTHTPRFSLLQFLHFSLYWVRLQSLTRSSCSILQSSAYNFHKISISLDRLAQLFLSQCCIH